MPGLMYFWDFDVPAEKEASFRQAAKDWRGVNNELPSGVTLVGFFEVSVGHGLGPRFQAILTAPDMASMEDANNFAGLKKLHAIVQPYAVPGSFRNRFLREL